MHAMTRRAASLALAILTAGGLAAWPASAKEPEKPDITLGVGGKPLLYYLPLTIAERKGYFKEEGLNVTINNFSGGSQSLQALIGGSVDVVTGAFEHTINMQAKGQSIKAVIELGRYPGIVLAVRKSLAGKIKSAADLKGAKIGVTAPGSSTNFFVDYLMAKAGLKPSDASFIGVGGGAGAVAGMEKGELDAISNLDPVISKLDADGQIVIIADSRTTKGTQAIFGAAVPAAVLYERTDFIEANPETTQRLVNAFAKALKWLATATPEQIADTVPETYWLGDKALYVRAVKNSLETYSRDGMIPKDGIEASYGMLKQFDPAIAKAKIDLDATFDDRFVKKAMGGK
jgi:NitT/TauT family transport system substrate-binding protein